MFETSVWDPMVTVIGILTGSRVSVLLPRIVMQDAVSKVFDVHDMKLHLEECPSICSSKK